MGARVLVVLAGARKHGLGHHLCEVVLEALGQSGATVIVQDLLADGFDPVLRLDDGAAHATEPDRDNDPLAARYARDLRLADAVILIHPVWWFAPPALLKGWVDRILVHGVALEQQIKGAPVGLLTQTKMLVVQTFNSSAQIDRVLFLGISGFFWKHVVGLPTGIQRVRRLALYGVEKLTPRRLQKFEQRLVRSVRALAKS